MRSHILSQVATGCVWALMGSGVTYVLLTRNPEEEVPAEAAPVRAEADAQVTVIADARQTLLFETTMADVLGRVASIREFERAPGTGSTAHRHPGSHTFGYVLEGTYEVRVGDGELRRLGPGETFYEPPGALHAVSRNGSFTEPVRYLVITVSDPTLPARVPEP